MKKIINGKIYNTGTAKWICDISGSSGDLPTTDFRWEDTSLYVTKKGTFFIAGRGNALSRWAISEGTGTTSGQGLDLIGAGRAQELFERFGNPDDFHFYFGEPEEG